MAHTTQKEYCEAKKQKQLLFNLILRKTGTKKADVFDLAMQDFIISNLDVVTEREKKQFDMLVF